MKTGIFVCDGRAWSIPFTLESIAIGKQSKSMAKKPFSADRTTELVTGLNKLARNLWWTWDQEAQELFQELSPRGWQNLYHNAVAILHELSEYELRVCLQNEDFPNSCRIATAL